MISMIVSLRLRGRARAAAPVCPGVSKPESKRGQRKEHEPEHGDRAQHWPEQHGEPNEQRDGERSRRSEPGENTKPADRVQRAEEEKQVATRATQEAKRRHEHDCQPYDQAPDELVVETKVLQL